MIGLSPSSSSTSLITCCPRVHGWWDAKLSPLPRCRVGQCWLGLLFASCHEQVLLQSKLRPSARQNVLFSDVNIGSLREVTVELHCTRQFMQEIDLLASSMSQTSAVSATHRGILSESLLKMVVEAKKKRCYGSLPVLEVQLQLITSSSYVRCWTKNDARFMDMLTKPPIDLQNPMGGKFANEGGKKLHQIGRNWSFGDIYSLLLEDSAFPKFHHGLAPPEDCAHSPDVFPVQGVPNKRNSILQAGQIAEAGLW